MKNHIKRNSNLEWIRIISMLLIVLGHFSWQTKWDFAHTNIFLQTGIQWLWFGGKLGVDLFVLISAYFLTTRKEIKFKPLVRLWEQVIFYSVLLTVIGVFYFKLSINFKEVLNTFFPIIAGAYWFVTAYVVMYLLAPYINIGLERLSKEQFKKLLIILMVIFSIVTIFHTESIGFIEDNAMVLIGVYPFGAYIRKYPEDILKIKNIIFSITIFLNLIILYLSALGINLIFRYLKHGIDVYAFSRFFISVSPFQLLIALSIFALFVKRPVQHNRVVNSVASHVFSVYLVHCQPLMIGFIWLDLVKANRFETTPYVFIYAVIITILIFSVSVIIDYFRQWIFQFISSLWNKIVHN